MRKPLWSFLRLATIDAEFDKGHGVIGRSWSSNWGGSIEPEVKRQFERSAEWRQFQDALLAVAESQAQASNAAVEDVHLSLLELILRKKATTLETWASDHKFGRTTVFDWKAGRTAGKSVQGKVSEEKSAEIEAAIEVDAAELGLTTRTNSDSSK